MAFEQSPKEDEGMSHLVILGMGGEREEHSRQREAEDDIWPSLSSLQITNFTSFLLTWIF